MMRKAVEDYLRCLEEERFYDAHEALESIWFPRRFEKGDEVQLLKGFINASVSFELIRRGRHEPSKRAWNTYKKYLPLMEKLPFTQQIHYRSLAEAVESTRKKEHLLP